ncbi:PXA domain-containing protein [Diaporthe helianthi]|uniref:PXA domain-containing protein n=1 Tax=Diaporthe helianthi TaxID=158607 RepID=A0A2P5HLX4_DIAHE|nr:PXA domain-containing protein [Diaporthe helianthi]
MANDAQLGALDRSNSSSNSSLLSAAGIDPLTTSTISFASHALPDGPKRPGSKHSRTSSNVSKRRSPRFNATPTDFLSDQATAQLIRRVLCPQQASDRGRATPAPIHDLLPPLTSRNDVDLQLYAIIAIILRDFVQAWYNKITPDETFVAEIVHIIAHVTRALEQRLRKIDIESLLLDELPDLLDKHIQAYRASRNPIVQYPVQADSRAIYHAMCPLPQLFPIPDADNPDTISKQAENEVAYRQLLIQGVLAVLLPTEDLENECLTSLVGEILSEMIIGGVVAKKVSEPWMIWTGLTILSDVLQRKQEDARRSRTTGSSSDGQGAKRLSIPGLFWSLVHYLFAFTTFVRVLVMTLATSGHLPSRGRVWPLSSSDSARHSDGSEKTRLMAYSSAELSAEGAKTPVLAFSIWPTISNWLEMDRRMPWLCGNLSMVQWLAIGGPGRVAGFDGVLDR